MMQGQGQDQDQGRVPYEYNQAWYPGALQQDYNQAWFPGAPQQDYNQAWIPGAPQQDYNQAWFPGATQQDYNQAWFSGARSNILYSHPAYTYPIIPPAMDMNMNMNGYNGGYYFNEPGTYYGNFYYVPPIDVFSALQPQPQPPLQEQPQPQPRPQPQPAAESLFNPGRRGSSSSMHSSAMNSNILQFYPLQLQPQLQPQPQPQPQSQPESLFNPERRENSSSRHSSAMNSNILQFNRQPQLQEQPQPQPQPQHQPQPQRQPQPQSQPESLFNPERRENSSSRHSSAMNSNILQFNPQPQLQEQPQPQPQHQHQPRPRPQPESLFNTERESSSNRHSSARNSNILPEAGRWRGRSRWRGKVLRENSNNNNNTSLPQDYYLNIGELMIRIRSSEGERSTQLQGGVEGQGHAEPDEHANIADGVSREHSKDKFFVIKSYCRENVVSSIRHTVWTSTRRGNKILNTAYRETRTCGQSVNASGSVFLFFTVKGSENFCGLGEMDGPVDFESSADCWDRDWKGKFQVKWHTIKDVPYSQFQNITFNTAGNPQKISIIYSRDAQEVEFEKGVEMLDIFNKYDSTTSLVLDDVSRSTALSEQQQSQQEQEQEQPDVEEIQKQKEKEEGGEEECEQHNCTGSASSEINTNQIQQDTTEDNPTDLQLQEIVNTDETTQLTTREIVNTDETTQMTTQEIKIKVDSTCDTNETQETHVDTCIIKLPKTSADKEEIDQSPVETNNEIQKTTVDTDATTIVNEDNTSGDTNQIMTPP